jgi:hypothetical protein
MWEGGGVDGVKALGWSWVWFTFNIPFLRGNRAKERILLLPLHYHDSNRLGIRGLYVNSSIVNEGGSSKTKSPTGLSADSSQLNFANLNWGS